ncbi:hypothetical protein AMTRI_Chr11g150760 [Amborella trichopoda]
MEKTWFCFIIFCIDLLLCEASSYVRPPPRPIIHTQHRHSESHPQQVHVSLAGKDGARISWVTESSHVASMVEYGTSAGKYVNSAKGDTTSYHYFFYSSPKIHHVKIGPLDPDTIYYYRCGGTGPEFTFKTPPPAFPVVFAVAGDLGQTEWTSSTLEHVKRTDYDVLLLPGDLSYADGQQPLWDSFGRFVEPLASSRPWMVTQGNHEIESIPIPFLNLQAFKAYNSRWLMPFQESGSNSNLYYSFEVSGVHVLMLGSYTDFNQGSAQYQWLRSDLAKVDRKRTPWLIALIHAPWYSTNVAHQGEGESMRKAMESLLFEARVDVVFAGHVHSYERFTRVSNNEANPCGPVHITIGDGGNREGLALSFKKPVSSLSMFREASFGHGMLTMFNNTHAQWTWHRNNESEAVVADQVWLESLSSTCACGLQQPSPSIQEGTSHDEF